VIRHPFASTAVAIVVAGAVAVGLSAVVAAREDPGVLACKVMAGKGEQAMRGRFDPMTAGEYDVLETQFAASSYPDIEVHGTAFIYTVRQAQDPKSTLSVYTQLIETYNWLVAACAAEDVALPTLDEIVRTQ
jgi:hypothetical protein